MEIPYRKTHTRAAAIETVKLSSKMMTGECSSTIDECAENHEYLVLIASLLAEHCDKAFHQFKDVCMMLWKSYIHGRLFGTDVLTNAQECGATYIAKKDWNYPSTRNARQIVKKSDRKEKKTDLYLVEWLSHFSVQTTDEGIRTVAKQMFDQMKGSITQVEQRKEELSKYAKDGFMEIIEKYTGMFYVVMSCIEFINPTDHFCLHKEQNNLVRKKEKTKYTSPLWGEKWYDKVNGREYTPGLKPLLREAIEECGRKKTKSLFVYMKKRWEELHRDVAFPLNEKKIEGHKRHAKNEYADINADNKVSIRCPTVQWGKASG